MANRYRIEILDSNSWRAIHHGETDPNGQLLRVAMENARRSYPQKRIRAVDDKTGALLDMLN